MFSPTVLTYPGFCSFILLFRAKTGHGGARRRLRRSGLREHGNLLRHQIRFALDSMHGEDDRMKQDRKVHEETAMANVVKVILDVLVNKECAVGTELP